MPVVSNTSPVSNLAIIGRLELLRERYGEVLIPPSVKSELDALTHTAAKGRIEDALHNGWLRVEPLPVAATTLVLPVALDPGEIEVIQLGRHLSAKLILDDALARTAARALGLPFTGLLGELVYAKQAGTLSSVKAEIARLRSDARFFVSAEVEAVILAGVGE